MVASLFNLEELLKEGFQALVIQDPALNGVIFYNVIGPFSKLHSSLVIHLEAN